ncbi:MAG: hypothetical protein LBF41_09775, partial [Deltaproteobacteria bacterium]|nr:hypothetical protein [Deltaproteobacteria bacterium]
MGTIFDPRDNESASLKGPDPSRRALDPRALLALARETGKLLNFFRPLDGYVPEEPVPEPPLSPEVARVLGAPTLTDYFVLTLKSLDLPPERTGKSPVLPRGPDSVDSALAAAREMIGAYLEAENREPGKYRRVRTELVGIETALLKAKKLLPAFREMAAGFSGEAHAKHLEARKLAEAVESVLSRAPEWEDTESDPEALALTAYTSTLRESLSEALSVRALTEGWSNETNSHSKEIERLEAALSGGKGRGSLDRRLGLLSERQKSLEKRGAELSLRGAETERGLKGALSALVAAEKRFSGEKSAAFREELEDLLSTVVGLLAVTVRSRENLAVFWRLSPSLVGKPLFLEKIFLASAVNLGIAQGTLEETKHKLSSRAGKLTSTGRVRAAAKDFLKDRRGIKADGERLAKTERSLASVAAALAAEKPDARKPAAEPGKEGVGGPARGVESPREVPGEVFGDGPPERDRELSALAAEKERLEASLADARKSLAESALDKSELVKTVKRAREALSLFLEDKKKVRDEIVGRRAELGNLRRRHGRLSELYNGERQKLKKLERVLAGKDEEARVREETLRAREEERKNLELRVAELSADLREITAEREKVLERFKELSEKFEELKNRETTLSMRLAAKEAELGEVNRRRARLGEIMASRKLHLDRLARAHNALKNSWKRRGALLNEANLERDTLRIKLDRKKEELITGATKLQELKAELGEARTSLETLAGEKEKLDREILEARELAREKDETREELARELESLKGLAPGTDPSPAAKVLGLALHVSCLLAAKKEEAFARELDDQKYELGAREAQARVEGANRELDWQDAMDKSAGELGTLRNENEELRRELDHLKDFSPLDPDVPGIPGEDPEGAPESGEEKREDGALLGKLTLALMVSLKRGEGRPGRDADDPALPAESPSAVRELESILAAKDKALAEKKGELERLVPLVRFFLEEGKTLWTGAGIAGAGPADGRETLAVLMAEENDRLEKELASLKMERRESAASKKSLVALNAELREKLSGLRPVLEFLLKGFQENSLMLAKAYDDRERATGRLKLLEAGTGVGAGAAAEVAGEPGELPVISEIRTLPEVPATDAVSEETHRELSALKGERTRLAGENASLSETAARQASDLAKLGTETKRLAEEKRRLENELAEKDSKLENVESELKKISENPPSDGRVETAWAAVNYLGAKAGDALARLEGQLRLQAGEMENAFAELQKRETRIKTLEENQDKLSLLYWTLVSLAGKGGLANLPPADGVAGARGDRGRKGRKGGGGGEGEGGAGGVGGGGFPPGGAAGGAAGGGG